MNDLQKIEFDMLKEFVNVCNILNLKYYLVCGSALGAVKYGGFIPWDDDVDVALPRYDYDIFIKRAKEFLPEHIFLQNYITDENYVSFSAKLRNSKTTYVESDQKQRNINHGVFIDVIPLDEYLENDSEFEKEYQKFRICKLSFLQSKEWYKNVIKRMIRPVINRKKIYQEFECYLRMLKSGNYCNLHNSKNGKLFFPKEVYGRGVASKFEGLDVIVPEKYDEYLTSYYGNWRIELPLEEQAGHHFYEILDVNHPYTDYIKNRSFIKHGRIRWKNDSQ